METTCPVKIGPTQDLLKVEYYLVHDRKSLNTCQYNVLIYAQHKKV